VDPKRDQALTWSAVGVVIIVIGVYHAALSAYFFDDDFQWLVASSQFHLGSLVSVADRQHFYRPVIEAYFGLAAPLFGGSPFLFHLVNVVLHAANAVLLLMLAFAVSNDPAYAFLAALFFTVQPADVDAIGWVSSLAEPLSALFGCLSLLAFIYYRRGHKPVAFAVSGWAFTAALLTHESSVVFFPLLVAAAWLVRDEHGRSWRPFAMYGAVLTAYLAVDLPINARNYVVVEGHYAGGAHAIVNALAYITALYVGHQNTLNDIAVATVLAGLFVSGTSRIRFAVVWLLLTLAPFVFFRWAPATRYVYLPAMGLSLLIADGALALFRAVNASTSRVRLVFAAAVVSILAVRFTMFAVANVNSFAARTDSYRQFVTEFRRSHGSLPHHALVEIDSRESARRAFLEAAVRWAYHDPSIVVAGAR
jgi:hypothetical protein